MSEKIAVIAGPTASGKTDAAIKVASMLHTDVITADSIQVYRGLDIGSAKPSKQEMMGVVHHMIDIADIDDAHFSVAEYKRQAEDCIRKLIRVGKMPLVAGGTGLYINALTFPLKFTEVPADLKLRGDLIKQENQNPGYLYDLLQKIDPDSAKRLHPNDKKRIMRAIEVFKTTSRTITDFGSDFQNKAKKSPPYDPVMIGLTMPRELLYDRINKRVDDMMRRGLLEEVRSIADKGYDHRLPALQGLGYKQLLGHLRGEYSIEEAVSQIKQETRRFAKRQWTWFKRDKRIQWLDVTEYSSTDNLALHIVQLISDAKERQYE
ncbi:MAG: tRNA dimethylallyltransferase [Firmicutes bacterium ADurb.Bin182]|nr:MAG: tRNA dimethylallyltransferase [Firmicutes bacterium ADurb.Bin182]